jgi:hypothetical protein
LIQPSNMPFPFPNTGITSGPSFQSISKIVFTLPDGTYDYNISRSAGPVPASGTVDVNGSDVTVQFEAEPVCNGGAQA